MDLSWAATLTSITGSSYLCLRFLLSSLVLDVLDLLCLKVEQTKYNKITMCQMNKNMTDDVTSLKVYSFFFSLQHHSG